MPKDSAFKLTYATMFNPPEELHTRFDEFFLLILMLMLLPLFHWGFKTLPGERWQIIGCLLGSKGQDGAWRGLNLTYYGFFNATAYLFASILFFILMGSLSIPMAGTLAILTAVLLICMPASRLIARWVEGKENTFTVAGAAFSGLIASPWIVLLVNKTLGVAMGFQAPLFSMLAAMTIAYAFGEGIGRLACISFGCCYGKPLSECNLLLQRIFRGRAFIFTGTTKKIAYAHHLDGQEVVPIQALTALLLTGGGLAGCYGFLKGFPIATFIGLLGVTQIWRVLSEFLRVDYRGTGKISAYQVMALLSVVYALTLWAVLPVTISARPDLSAGLLALWNPGALLFFEILWLAAFIHTGRSRVTGATVRLHVVEGNI